MEIQILFKANLKRKIDILSLHWIKAEPKGTEEYIEHAKDTNNQVESRCVDWLHGKDKNGLYVEMRIWLTKMSKFVVIALTVPLLLPLADDKFPYEHRENLRKAVATIAGLVTIVAISMRTGSQDGLCAVAFR